VSTVAPRAPLDAGTVGARRVAPAAPGAGLLGPTLTTTPPPGLLRPGWPVTALLVLYPLWWLLGMGTLIVFVLAVPMALHLLRRRPVRVPPGFGIWLLFLLWVLASVIMLPANPPGTLPAPVSGRLLSVAFNLAGYLSATVILLYVGNLSEAEFPRRRLMRQLGGFFVVVVCGGLLGLVAPTFQLTSPVEMLLPAHVAQNGFVRSLVHPASSQLMDVLGFTSPRPSAPFGYTNTWGNCFALLLGWFVVSWLFKDSSPRRRVAGLALLAVAAVPVVYSLNRGLWVALGLAAAYTALRLAQRGKVALIATVMVGMAVGGVVVAASPLATIIQQRFEHQHSNNIRSFTINRTLEVVGYSPVIGVGSTRAALGSSRSIVVGPTAKCPRCGNPTLGSNGQIWLLLIAQGIGGALLYVGFFLRSLWAYRRDSSPIGDAGLLTLLLPLFFMLVYNSLTMPLIITFLAIALLWRNQQASTPEVPFGTPEHGIARAPIHRARIS
jgi:hypothetical protein